MILGYETILNKIIEVTQLPKVDIESKINQKLKDLQDLISKEGAAHIVANELKVKLFDLSLPKTFKIKEIKAGLNAINLVCRIININDVRTFKRNNRDSRVGSMLVGDETGSLKIVVWDEKIIDSLKDLKEGSVIKVSNAYSKENNNYLELHLGNRAIIENSNETIGEIRLGIISKRKHIKDLKENDFVEVFGTIVQMFDPRFYNACPVCSKKILMQEDSFVCQEHGKVPVKQVPILNIVFDDGTGNIRSVLFRENAEKIIGKDYSNLDAVRKDVLGKQLLLKGKVNKNELYSRMEFMVNSVEPVNPEILIKELEN